MQYTISVSAGSNGTTVPDASSAQVPAGAGYLIKFEPFSGFRVADVLIDGVSIGAVAQYTFTNVTANHTVSVAYALSHYRATSRYTLSNLVDPVDPLSTPQYEGMRLKAEVSTPSVASNAFLSLSNVNNSVTFSWKPGKASLEMRTLDVPTGEWRGSKEHLVCGNGPYWVEMTVVGASVYATMKGEGLKLELVGTLRHAGGNNISTGWVVTVDSSASGPGVNETLFEGFKVVADDKQSTILVGSAYSEKTGKLLTVLAG